jgi:hypothetical protein
MRSGATALFTDQDLIPIFPQPTLFCVAFCQMAEMMGLNPVRNKKMENKKRQMPGCRFRLQRGWNIADPKLFLGLSIYKISMSYQLNT